MANELTKAERIRGQALLAGLAAAADGVVDAAMPGLSDEDAILATRVLLGCGEALAGQLVAAARGQEFDDVLEIGLDGVARPAPIREDPAPLD